MSTVEITAIEDVQVGDLVTLEDRRDPSDGGTFKPDPEWRLIGHVRAIDVTTTDNDGRPYGWGVQIGHTPYPVGYLSPGGVMWAYSLVSATREVPEWKPGTAGRGWVHGVARDGFFASDAGSGRLMFFFPDDNGVQDVASSLDVTDFVPDDAEALRADLAKAIQERDFWHQQYDDREEVTRTMRHGRRAQRERAEAAERERDEMQGDLQTQIQITRDVRAERDKALAEVERLEAEVERLRAARTVPTRKQLVGAMWPDAPESARAGMTHLDIVDRILALIEQGDES